jgi:ABC-2 type transport system permease protein
MSTSAHSANESVRNPMIRKELRQRMRERKGWILPSLYLCALAAVIALTYYFNTASPSSHPQGSSIGVSVFLAAAFAQLLLLLLLAPVFSAGTLTIEKEQRTLGGLLTSLLTPAQIWWGKFVSSLMYVLLLLLAGLPILSVAVAFGGIGLWDVAIVTFTTVVILGVISAVSLYWSSAFRRSVHATAVSYVTVIALSLVTFVIFIIGESITKPDSFERTSLAIKAPLYINPVYFLLVSLSPARGLYPHWFICLGAFLAIAALSILLTVRNLRRSGDIV